MITNTSTAHLPEIGNPSAMPIEVRWALLLLWLGISIALAHSLYDLYLTYVSYKSGALTTALEIMGTGSFIMMSVNPLIVLICHGYLNIGIARRKNWARIVKLLLVVGLFVYPAVQNLYSSYNYQKLGITLPPMNLTAFQYFMNGIVPALTWAGLYLLFFSPGRLWFRRASSPMDV